MFIRCRTTFKTRFPSHLWISLCSLACMAMVVLLLIACAMVYHARWNAYSRLWRVLEAKEKDQGAQKSQASIAVKIDAQHVLYVGTEEHIVPLDGIFDAIKTQMKRLKLQGDQESVVMLRVAAGVESGMLIALLAQLEGFPVQMSLEGPEDLQDE